MLAAFRTIKVEEPGREAVTGDIVEGGAGVSGASRGAGGVCSGCIAGTGRTRRFRGGRCGFCGICCRAGRTAGGGDVHGGGRDAAGDVSPAARRWRRCKRGTSSRRLRRRRGCRGSCWMTRVPLDLAAARTWFGARLMGQAGGGGDGGGFAGDREGGVDAATAADRVADVHRADGGWGRRRWPRRWRSISFRIGRG